MNEKPKVGDKVRLNDYGLRQCFNASVGLAPLKRIIHTVTWVDSESMTAPEETWVIRISDPDLSSLMINHRCFDLVERPEPCPECDGVLDTQPGGGVKCGKCGYWECF
jgi:ribosomal protein S27AE